MLSGESNNRKLNRLGSFLPLCPVFVKINLQYLWVQGDLRKLQSLYQYQPGLHWSNAHLGALCVCWKEPRDQEGRERAPSGGRLALEFLLFSEMIWHITVGSVTWGGLEMVLWERHCGINLSAAKTNKAVAEQSQLSCFASLSPTLDSTDLCLWSLVGLRIQVMRLHFIRGVCV